MIKIDYYGLDFSGQEKLNDFLVAAWDYAFPNVEASAEFTFVNAEEIQAINYDIRDLDKVTDVLSLEYEANFKDNYESYMGNTFIGEIFLNIDCIQKQADEHGHSYDRELCFLALHALLHLVGYDHMNLEDEKNMRERQTEILNQFKVLR